MVTVDMLKSLQKELKVIFENFLFDTTEKKVEIYIQNEPRPIGMSEDEEFAPYQVIKAPGGTIGLDHEGRDDKEDLEDIVILIVCSDKSEEQVAWIDVVNQIERISQRFVRNPVFGGKYQVKKISWMQADENPYPLCLGGVQLKVQSQSMYMEATDYD